MADPTNWVLEHKMRANPTLPRLPFSTPIFKFRVYKNPGIVIKIGYLGTHSITFLNDPQSPAPALYPAATARESVWSVQRRPSAHRS